jgi:hypothetical protein
VKSSAIVRPDGTAITDTGSGYNGFSLEVTGGTTPVSTHLYALDDLSIWTNTPAAGARVFLAEVGPGSAGKRLQVDLFDPGDGTTGQYTLQVLAPPAGAPGAVPTTGAAIPAPGLADSCRFNPTPSATRGPDVSGSGGADAADCRVTTTRVGGTIQVGVTAEVHEYQVRFDAAVTKEVQVRETIGVLIVPRKPIGAFRNPHDRLRFGQGLTDQFQRAFACAAGRREFRKMGFSLDEDDTAG